MLMTDFTNYTKIFGRIMKKICERSKIEVERPGNSHKSEVWSLESKKFCGLMTEDL